MESLSAKGGSVSLVVPCFGTTDSFGPYAIELCSLLGSSFSEVELVLVVDGLEVPRAVSALGAMRAGFASRVVRLQRHSGEQVALATGILVSRGATVITVDDDCQHPAASVLEMVYFSERNKLDLAYGMPTNQPHGWFRGALSAFGKKIVSYSAGIDMTFVASLRVINGTLRTALRSTPAVGGVIDGQLIQATRNIGSLRVPYAPRVAGKSSYNAVKLFIHFLNLMMSFPTRMLNLAGLFGVFALLAGLAVLVWALGEAIFGYGIPGGYLSGLGIFLFVSGALLVNLYVLGEFVTRVIKLLNAPQLEESYLEL